MSDQARIVGALSAAQVVGGIGNGTGLAVAALLVRDVTGSTALAGMAVVLVTLGAAIVTVPLASLAAARGRRPALVTGWLVGATGAFLCVAAAELESAILLFAGLAGYGASTAANLQSRFAATDRAAPDRVGSSLSIVVWSTTIGAVAGPNLTGPGAAVARSFGVPEISGPFVLTVVSFAAAGLITWLFLRPEPSAGTDGTGRHGVARALSKVRGTALAAIGVICAAHAVMVAVMSLTPVHMDDHGLSLQLIGFTISLHIAGMFALSPLFGFLTDTWGPYRVIGAGQVVLIAALVLAGTSGDSHLRIAIGLTLLGVGWSASVIAAATLLTTSTPAAERTGVQGASDLAMNLCGAAGGLLAGVVVSAWSFEALSIVAIVLTVPSLALAVTAPGREPTVSG